MNARGSADESEVGLRFSLHPLRREPLHPAIEAPVKACASEGVDDTVSGRSPLDAGSTARLCSDRRCKAGSTKAVRPGRSTVIRLGPAANARSPVEVPESLAKRNRYA
jgi:hypothetical protein